MEEQTDQEIIRLLKQEGQKGLRLLFDQYYNYMCHAVYRIIPDQSMVEDIVQEVYYELWRKRKHLEIKVSLKAYLRKASVNRALNHIRDQKIKFDEEEKIHELELSTPAGGQRKLEADEFEKMIHKAIDQLPPKCRIVFSMSRFEEMSYQEIANSLGISIKTVENQISKALRMLRDAVYPYLQKNK